MKNTRELVLEGLLSFDKELDFSSKIIKEILDKNDDLTGQDKAFIKRLFEGVIERRIELDHRIDLVSKTPVHKMKPVIRNLIRMGTYQLIYMDSVPDSAAINESVKLAKKRGLAGLSGFVNANLRAVSKNKTEDIFEALKDDRIKYLSVRYSVPEWICEKWVKEDRNYEAERLLDSLLKTRPVSLRFNTKLTDDERKACLSKIENEGVRLTNDSRLDYVFSAEGIKGLKNLPGYDEGLFTVQDISSCLAIEAAGIKQGDCVIDVCAAPGGKSILASEKAGESGKVFSFDLSEDKIPLIKENARRMKAENIDACAGDGSVKKDSLIEKADVLILDVPCSGLGVMGKKRDIKYNASPKKIAELIKIQESIVDASWEYVKKGGRLIYSTCTINPDENEKQAERIAAKYPFKIVAGPVQLLPHKDHCDGFFYAVFERIE